MRILYVRRRFSVKIENFIKCETAFEIKINTTGPIEDNFLTRVGSFVAIVNHGSDQLTSSTLKVYAGNLSQSVSSLQIIGQSQVQTGEMKAGEEAVLSLQGKDAQGNAIDFYDIAEHFRIDFEGLTQGETYLAEIKPNDDNTELRIKLTINKVGTFEFTWDDSQVYILTGGDKLVKLYLEGDTETKEINDGITNADRSTEFTLQFKGGCGVAFNKMVGNITFE